MNVKSAVRKIRTLTGRLVSERDRLRSQLSKMESEMAHLNGHSNGHTSNTATTISTRIGRVITRRTVKGGKRGGYRPSRWPQMKALLAKGKSPIEVAAALKVTPAAVYNARKKHGK